LGVLVDGTWRDQWYDTESTGGRFQRQEQRFRSWVTADGSPGPSGSGGFRAEAGRYHLYVALACPWAHRTLIFRALKGLEDLVPISVVHWFMGEHGWTFDAGDGVIPDPNENADYLYQLYLAADPLCSGRVTVPTLWDKASRTIVNNESSEIIRMFNSAFDHLGARDGDYYPEPLRAEIDDVNERVYGTLNNGVYEAGFATTQEAYDDAVYPLFDTMEWLENRLSGKQFLVGGRLTEADIRLFTTLVRFDAVYVTHFKCNLKRLVDYPNLWRFTRELFRLPEIRTTVDFDHIKRHYFGSHRTINPSGIVPAGPVLDFGSGV
jgi:putative glutathione S-transferase